jgi:hypothetical protein
MTTGGLLRRVEAPFSLGAQIFFGAAGRGALLPAMNVAQV